MIVSFVVGRCRGVTRLAWIVTSSGPHAGSGRNLLRVEGYSPSWDVVCTGHAAGREEELGVAVYEYSCTVRDREDFMEFGTVIAGSEDDARMKLRGLRFEHIRLKKLGGISSFLKQFSADVR